MVASQSMEVRRDARPVFARHARRGCPTGLGRARFRLCRGRGLCGSSLLRACHHRPGAGGGGLPRGHALPAGIPQRGGVQALRQAKARLSGLLRRDRQHGQSLHRRAQAAKYGRVRPRRACGPASRPRGHGVLQPHPRGVSGRAGAYRRGGGVAAPLFAL